MTYTPTLIFSFLFLSSSVGLAKSTYSIEFVKHVPKNCKHLNDIRVSFNGKKLYWISKGTRVVRPDDLFTNKMRQEAKKIGANRLMVADFFHNRKLYYRDGGLTWVTIKKTMIRARAFRCRP